MLVGLAAKNGILIVEFANQLRDEGTEIAEAIRMAAARRLRAILMTSIATSAGAVPLMFASGAGAAARSAIGVVIVFGVTLATLITLFLIPILYSRLGETDGFAPSSGPRAGRGAGRAAAGRITFRTGGRVREIASKGQLRLAFLRWAMVTVPFILLLGFASARLLPDRGSRIPGTMTLRKPDDHAARLGVSGRRGR